jgi:hypothetical protein
MSTKRLKGPRPMTIKSTTRRCQVMNLFIDRSTTSLPINDRGLEEEESKPGIASSWTEAPWSGALKRDRGHRGPPRLRSRLVPISFTECRPTT